MSTPAELIAALTAAIDHPNPSPPPAQLEGSASPGDQIPVPALIEQLRTADTNATAADARKVAASAAAASAQAAFTTLHAEWLAGQPVAFADWDRAVRALETLASGSAGAPLDIGNIPAAQQRTSAAIVLAKSARVANEAIRAVTANQDAYFDSLRGEPKLDVTATRSAQLASDQASNASAGLGAVSARAEQYLSYLSTI